MSIRHVNKDHLAGHQLPLSVVPSPKDSEDDGDPLRFLTRHKRKPGFIDLTEFRDGQETAPRGKWGGAFKGRPNLIAQIAPALREAYLTASKPTVTTVLTSLRTWWRLLDRIEAIGTGAAVRVPAVNGVEDLVEVHRQLAFDAGMSRAMFGPFTRVTDLTRRAIGLRPLHWVGPEEPTRKRHLPPFSQIKPIRDELKRRWYAALDRWERADALVAGVPPETEEEVLQVANYRRLAEAAAVHGRAWPTSAQLWLGRSMSLFYQQGYKTEVMRSRFPGIADVKAAFHLCLVTTGWNPETFLALDVGLEFIQPHPKDETRYLLTGFKERSRTEQVTEGLYKSQRSPGVILLTLMRRTATLRVQLQAQRDAIEAELRALVKQGARTDSVDEKREQLSQIDEGLRSPWLFADEDGAVSWLNGDNYHRDGNVAYLDRLVQEVNAKRPPEHQVAKITATDFRDAFAAYAYQESGGMVLYVMRVLGHKRLSSTQRYLDNSLLNDESARIFRTFANSLWVEIRVHGRLDPTVLAKWSRDGTVSEGERKRLEDYRALKRSRLGVGCKSPTSPSRAVAPTFRPDGKTQCSTHRCTLCIENAVILPESLDGLAMRLAELLYLQASMPTATFAETSFAEELHNTQVALLGFEPSAVSEAVERWQRRIAEGAHRPVHLELME
jgi:hypothetical protein